jgi:hypothetical protein
MSLSWNQPTCEACWIDKHSHWNDDTGMLETIDRPVMVREADIEQCSYCGNLTIMGIYTRADPATVPYPKEKDE